MRDGLRPAEDGVVKRAVSELPEMSDEAFAAGRAKLLARMGRTAEAAPEEATPAAVVPLQRRRRRHVAWLAAAAVVVGVMVVVLVGPSVVPSDGPEPKIGSAVAAEALSQAASKTGDVVLKPGQFLYVRNRTTTSSMAEGDGDSLKWLYTTDETYETWIPADQGQLWEHKRTSSGVQHWLKGSQAADRPDNWPPLQVLGDWKARNGDFFGDQPNVDFRHPTPAYLAALPRDPKKLYEKLRAEAVGDEGPTLLREIGEGLDSGLIPADLRKAVFQALAYLPKLQVVDKEADLDGRPGQAFGMLDDNQLDELIIDTTTGQYLGSRETLVRDWQGIKAGTVLSSSSLTTKVVDAMGRQ
jgi:hypothetical protein